MESTDDYRQKIYEKLQRIRNRSEDLGAASVLVSLYSGEKVALIKDLTKMSMLYTDEELEFSPQERSQMLQVLFKLFLKHFDGDCAKLVDNCRNAYRLL